MELTKDYIVELLRTNDRAIGRALVVLTERQTVDERAQLTTKYRNGRGFRPCHAKMGISMGKFFKAANYISPTQANWWRVREATGKMRIEIYAEQLLDIAIDKQQRKIDI